MVEYQGLFLILLGQAVPGGFIQGYMVMSVFRQLDLTMIAPQLAWP